MRRAPRGRCAPVAGVGAAGRDRSPSVGHDGRWRDLVVGAVGRRAGVIGFGLADAQVLRRRRLGVGSRRTGRRHAPTAHRSGSSSQSVEPSAPQIATSGCVGGSSSATWPGRWRQSRTGRRDPDEQERHDHRGRDPEERPVVRAQRLEPEAHEPVPDEEQQDDVAGPKPRAEPVAHPQQEQHAEEARERLVEEQRVEPGRPRRTRGTGRRRSGGCSRSGCPTGSVVGGPYSSWLKKLPQRAMACIRNRPGATMSAQRQNGRFL